MIKCAKPFLLIMVLNAVTVAVTLQTSVLWKNVAYAIEIAKTLKSFIFAVADRNLKPCFLSD